MTTVSGTFTAVGVSSVLRVPERGDQITVTISGTYDQEIFLERALGPDLSAWEVVKAWKVEDATVAFTMPVARYNEIYRLNCKVDDGGTSTYSLADGDKTLFEFKDTAGNVLWAVKESGIEFTSPISAPAQGVGTVTGTGVSVVESGNGFVQKSTFTLTAVDVVLTDAAGDGQAGGVQIYDFPAGNIRVLGVVVDADIVLPAPFIDTAAGDIALGSVAPTGAVAFSGTEEDIMVETAIAALASKAGPIDAQSTTDLAPLGAAGGTDSNCFVNIRIDDDVAHTTETGVVTGTIVLTWVNLGDIA